MNKDQIIEGIIRGDQYTLNHFYRKQTDYVGGFILGNQGNLEDVEDTVQEALIELYKKLKFDGLQIKSSISTYFFGMCKNIWLTRLKSKKRLIIRDIKADGKEDVNDSLKNYLEEDEKRHLYLRSFQKLNDENRLVLGLYFDGKSMREIAKTMGFTEGNTRKKKFKAKKKLMEIIEKDPMYRELEHTNKTA